MRADCRFLSNLAFLLALTTIQCQENPLQVFLNKFSDSNEKEKTQPSQQGPERPPELGPPAQPVDPSQPLPSDLLQLTQAETPGYNVTEIKAMITLLVNITPSDLEGLRSVIINLNGNVTTLVQFQLALQTQSPGMYAILQRVLLPLAAQTPTPAPSITCPPAVPVPIVAPIVPSPQPAAAPTAPILPAIVTTLEKVCPPGGGNWSEFGNPTTCTDACGNCGTQQLTRTCLSASINNCPCSGPNIKTQNCNPIPCAYPRKSCCGSFTAKILGGQIVCA